MLRRQRTHALIKAAAQAREKDARITGGDEILI